MSTVSFPVGCKGSYKRRIEQAGLIIIQTTANYSQLTYLHAYHIEIERVLCYSFRGACK